MNDQEVAVTHADPGSAKVIYILYLVTIAVGITGLIGVIMAYVNRSDAPDWLRTHYRYQIRTFWIGTLYNLIGAATVWIVIGWFIFLFALVWWIIRCVKGMKALEKGEAVENPAGWMFG